MIIPACVLVVLLGVALAYKCVLAAVALMESEQAPQTGWPPVHRFAMVIPALDEEQAIREAVDSCRASNYPGDRFAVFVIADNCSDQTAERASLAGAQVLERMDPTARGKGQALRWGFERILPLGFDALVILDADCRIEPHALRAFDRALEAGERVLQCSDVVANPDESALSFASAVGNVIENDLFYEPKSRLGLAVLLRGTGMVFHREILERFPWKADSVTEDAQYTLELIRSAIRIKFLPDVRVLSPSPVTPRQLMVQRRRWAAGVAGLGKRKALKLLINGAREGNVQLFDAGWTLLVLSRPVLVLLTMLTLALALSNLRISPGKGAETILKIATCEAFLLVSYFALGIFRLGVNRHRLVLLAQAPFVVAQLIGASLLGIFGREDDTWRRTPRHDEAQADSHRTP